MNNSKLVLSRLRDLVTVASRSNSTMFGSVFGSKVAQASQSHSKLLANQQFLFDLQIHQVKPEHTEDYEKYCEEYMPTLTKKYPNSKLTGSWRSEIGQLDTYVHLFRYKNYSEYAATFNLLNQDEINREFKTKTSKMIRHRERQVCLSFNYWPKPEERDEPHIYEMRTYALKPGTLIEWGNNWERGIRNRLEYCVAGMFTQVGPLFHVHHIWAYKDLESRRISREEMWQKPGWDECVSYTVPLIRKMDSKIMSGLSFSTMK